MLRELPDLKMLALSRCGAVLRRGAGCTVNDILDPDIDNKVSFFPSLLWLEATPYNICVSEKCLSFSCSCGCSTSILDVLYDYLLNQEFTKIMCLMS
jgi:hypothetical protein